MLALTPGTWGPSQYQTLFSIIRSSLAPERASGLQLYGASGLQHQFPGLEARMGQAGVDARLAKVESKLDTVSTDLIKLNTTIKALTPLVHIALGISEPLVLSDSRWPAST